MVRPERFNWLTAWLEVLAGAMGIGLVSILALIGLGALAEDQTPPAAPPTEVLGSPAPKEVNIIHTALHDIGSRCTPSTKLSARAQRELAKDVDDIVSFASRYPGARFPIDDESGTALSLLFATRDELRVCSPTQAARINQVMPAEFRDSTRSETAGPAG